MLLTSFDFSYCVGGGEFLRYHIVCFVSFVYHYCLLITCYSDWLQYTVLLVSGTLSLYSLELIHILEIKL